MRNLMIAILVVAVVIPTSIVIFHNQQTASSVTTLENSQKTVLVDTPKKEPTVQKKLAVVDQPQSTTVKKPQMPIKKKERAMRIVIDAGHQRYADYRLERVGPQSNKWLPSMPPSSYGVTTGQAEHQLTLDVAKNMQQQLKKKGYEVFLTRQKNVIALTTMERAKIAKKHKADLYISLHADGASKPNAQGMYIIMPGKSNPYTKHIYKESAQVGKSILKATKKKSIPTYLNGENYSADLATLNWSSMPVVLVELGYLNNVKDDRRLATKSYQQKLSTGLIVGIDNYFNKK
ncbi:N-acetylmuramoyl-L-alanine amidase family protein [Kurthia sibirica]|uniref:MurNAc-LAA domain-containing protein n=1 Tax=Kurthia sibirica TaxID=202750 RepID=A0A2U3AJY7_9BACL|nr:N-acetylmuramoyl-L-alanine amidase [Kurthia sibirica]PWI24856.1 hypothetical protein DEX24_11385 [Kurthia sibirica]GEK33294.1 N-acetylmuramoyl-L-alanine amidase [Kurthia sibirica]